MKKTKKILAQSQTRNIISLLKARFEKNMKRHRGLDWDVVEERLQGNAAKLWTLNEMEASGGEPDVVGFDKKSKEIIFFDCSAETPKGRRSLCYDREALDARKKFKPANSAVDVADEMGVEILNEEQYAELQKLGAFDLKTSSWLRTPDAVRKLGGAIFADRRFDRVFVYHNGAESYYGGRGFRGAVRV